MRKILASLVVVLTVLGVVAYADVASIAQDMMGIERYAKQIQNTVGDRSQNQQNAAYANQIVLLFQDTLNKVPDIIGRWPKDQQPAIWQNYQQHIQYAMGLASQLQTALQNNDNATAAALIQQLFEEKTRAHSAYNP